MSRAFKDFVGDFNELIGTVNTATTAINQQNLDLIAKASALSKITKKADWNLD